jgi:hypothetical protein
MRIKTLLAASLAAVAIPAMAADVPVYSQNIVGYVNLPIKEGFNLVANQLDADGTGVNNWTTNVFGSQLPINTIVYAYNGTGYDQGTYSSNKLTKVVKWTASPNVNPGRALWVQVPTGALGGQTQQVVTVGQVLQGPLVNPYMGNAAAKFGFVASMIPVAGSIQTNMNYQPKVNDIFFKYNGVGYDQTTYSSNKLTKVVKWTAGEPTVNVGQGFWLQAGVAAGYWSNNFTPTP